MTEKRLKWADTSGKSATMAVVTGSKTVLEEGVNIPSRIRFAMLGAAA